MKMQSTFRGYGDTKPSEVGVNFGDIFQFLFRDMGYFSEYLKGNGIAWTPVPGTHTFWLRYKKIIFHYALFKLTLYSIITPFGAFDISCI